MNVKFLISAAIVLVAFVSLGSTVPSRTRKYKEVFSYREKCSDDKNRASSRSSLPKLIRKLVQSILKEVGSEAPSRKTHSQSQYSSSLLDEEPCEFGITSPSRMNVQDARDVGIFCDSPPSQSYIQSQYSIPVLNREPCEYGFISPSRPQVQYDQNGEICYESRPSQSYIQSQFALPE